MMDSLSIGPIKLRQIGKFDMSKTRLRTAGVEGFEDVAIPERLEPPTLRLGNECSILLSYGTPRVFCKRSTSKWGGGICRAD
jgi:hypothetical protein